MFLADENQYEWFKNAVRGKPPLTIQHLSKEEIETRFLTIHDDNLKMAKDITPRPHGFGNYDGNIDWAKKLDFYSKLDKPFNGTVELFAQWRRFRRYCGETDPFFTAIRATNRKRKRS
jgi:hypothetical protein